MAQINFREVKPNIKKELTKNEAVELVCVWADKIIHNLKEHVPWYIGIPGEWWHGMSEGEFLRNLEKHKESHAVQTSLDMRKGA